MLLLQALRPDEFFLYVKLNIMEIMQSYLLCKVNTFYTYIKAGLPVVSLHNLLELDKKPLI